MEQLWGVRPAKFIFFFFDHPNIYIYILFLISPDRDKWYVDVWVTSSLGSPAESSLDSPHPTESFQLS